MLRKMALLTLALVVWLVANPVRVRMALVLFTVALILVSLVVPSLAVYAGEATGGSHNP